MSGEKREDLGKRATKALRNEKKIPCVMYGGEEVLHFSTVFHEVRDLVFTPDFKVADVHIDGETYRAIVKQVQWHPVTDEILHIDFLRLIEGVPVKISIPIHFEGTSPGVRNGGTLLQKLRRATVKTRPENLVTEIVLDISGLKMSDSLRVRDIELGDDVEILNDPGVPVATVASPRSLRTLLPEDLEEEEEVLEGAEEGEGEGAEAEGEEPAAEE